MHGPTIIAIVIIAIIILIGVFYYWRKDHPVWLSLAKTASCAQGVKIQGQKNPYLDGKLSACESACSADPNCRAFTQEGSGGANPSRCYFYTDTANCCLAQKTDANTTLYSKKPWYKFWGGSTDACEKSGKSCPTKACA